MDRLHVATLNIRNLADRWDERLPLLLADMAALQPDLLGLQEVVYAAPAGPADRRGGRGPLRSVRGWAGRPEYGNAMLVREPLAAARRRAARPRARTGRRSGLVALPGRRTRRSSRSPISTTSRPTRPCATSRRAS